MEAGIAPLDTCQGCASRNDPQRHDHDRWHTAPKRQSSPAARPALPLVVTAQWCASADEESQSHQEAHDQPASARDLRNGWPWSNRWPECRRARPTDTSLQWNCSQIGPCVLALPREVSCKPKLRCRGAASNRQGWYRRRLTQRGMRHGLRQTEANEQDYLYARKEETAKVRPPNVEVDTDETVRGPRGGAKYRRRRGQWRQGRS